MAAIYMWFDPEEQVWTTTLYPIEVIDGLSFAADIHYGLLTQFPYDAATQRETLTSVELIEVLISTDTYEDQTTQYETVVNVLLASDLISVDAGEDTATQYETVIDVLLEDLLVTVDTPDELLQLGCDINSSNCSMTPV